MIMNQSDLYKKIETLLLKSKKTKKTQTIELSKKKCYIYIVECGKSIIIGNKGTKNLHEIEYLCNLLSRKFEAKNVANIEQPSYYDIEFKNKFIYKLIELK